MITYIDSKKRSNVLESNAQPIWRNESGKVVCPGKEKCQRCSENCPIFLNTRGMELVSQNEHEKAIILFKRAIEIAPDFYDVHNNLAACYGLMGEYEKASKAYMDAHNAENTKANPVYGLALSMRDLGKDLECLQWCLEYEGYPKDKSSRKIADIIDDVFKKFMAKHSLTEILLGRNYKHYKLGVYCREGQKEYEPDHQVQTTSASKVIAREWQNDNVDGLMAAKQPELKPFLGDDCWLKFIPSRFSNFEYYILVLEIEADRRIKNFYVIRKIIGAKANDNYTDYEDVIMYERCSKLPPEVCNEIIKMRCCRYIPKDFKLVGRSMPQRCREYIKIKDQQVWFYYLKSPFYPGTNHLVCHVDENNIITSIEYDLTNEEDYARFKNMCRPFGIDYYNSEIADAILALIEQYTPTEYMANVIESREEDY